MRPNSPQVFDYSTTIEQKLSKHGKEEEESFTRRLHKHFKILTENFCRNPILESRPDHNQVSYILYSLQEVHRFFNVPC